MVSSKGPCRLGEFCELLHVILGKQGCNYEWIVLDTPSDIGIRELFQRIRRIFPDKRMTPGEQKKLIVGINHTRHLIFEMEKFESELRREAGYYENPIKAIHLIRLCRRVSEKSGESEAGIRYHGTIPMGKNSAEKRFFKKTGENTHYRRNFIARMNLLPAWKLKTD